MEMKSSAISHLEIHFPQLSLRRNLTPPPHLGFRAAAPSPNIVCGLRKGLRKPLWRSTVLSSEAIQAVQSLKLAKSAAKMEEVIGARFSRLLKADLLDTLTELQRQNELELSLQVFKFMRNEAWYEPDLSFYHGMILLLGRNKEIERAEGLFHEMRNSGLEPDTRAFNEMMGAYFQVGMIEKAIKTYGSMKESGCIPDRLTFKILINSFEKFGEEFAAVVKKDCDEYLDSPEKFLEQIERKQMKT